MKNLLNYRWFHFGPLLIRTKVKQPDLLKVKKLISKTEIFKITFLISETYNLRRDK